MDLTTIIGIVAAIVLIVSGIGFGNITDFLDLGSFLIVIGGTFAGLVACFPTRILKQIPKHLKIAVMGNENDPMKTIDSVVEYAMIARKNGLLALEEKANDSEDVFLKQGLFLIVDAIDTDKVKQVLSDELNYLNLRHEEGANFYERGAAFGPAFGLLGTLIGLIKMLKAMSFTDGSGAENLGIGMSMALITTFYGVLIANLLFTPIANKLRLRHEEEILCKELIIEGVLSIQSGENPKFIREKLVSYLPQKFRDTMPEEEGIIKPKKEKKFRIDKKEKNKSVKAEV